MRTVVLLAALLMPASLLSAADLPHRITVYDFEAGVEGWWGNAWGGGKCTLAESNDCKYGKRALRGAYEGVQKGANVVGPFFAEDAAWRKGDYDRFSLWFKGDGSNATVRLHADSSQPGSTGFSANVPLKDEQWHRVTIPFHTFWSREKLRLGVSDLKRIMFGCSGTHHFWVDQIALERPHRELPLDALPGEALVPAEFALELYDQREHVVRFDAAPYADREGLEARASLTLPGAKVEQKRIMIPAERARLGEVEIAFDTRPQSEGTGKVEWSLLSAGRPLKARSYAFEVFLPVKTPSPPIVLLPQPKEVKLDEGAWELPAKLEVSVEAAATEELTWCLDLLTRELKTYYAIDVQPRQREPRRRGMLALRLGRPGGAPPTVAQKTIQRLGELGPEAYSLQVAPSGAALAARTPRGLYYGLQTLLQLVATQTVSPDQPRAPAVSILDWPALPIRALSVPLPTSRWGYPNDPPCNPADFCDFLFRTACRWKLNTVVLLLDQAVKWDTHPEIAGPAAWTKDQFRTVLDFCRRNFIEVVPSQNSLGHANWLVIPIKELREDGDTQTMCTSNPRTRQILSELYGEQIEFTQARSYHVGLDEVRWKTERVPEEKRCRLCAGKSKPEIWVDQVRWLRDFLHGQGVKMWMWGDMILPQHNGGPPYFLAPTIDRLPKDVTICNWSTSLAPQSSRYFKQHGFARVIQSNSRGVSRIVAKYVEGNMMGLWAKAPWLSESYFLSSQAFSYLSLVPAAQYSWNLYQSDTELPPGLEDSLLQQCRHVLRQLALQPEPAGGAKLQPLALPGDAAAPAGVDLTGLPTGEVKIAGLPFQLSPERKCLSVTSDVTAPIKVGRRVAALYFLHSCRVPADKREDFNKQFRRKEALFGVEIARYVIRYEDGATAVAPVKYGWNCKSLELGRYLPYAYAALGTLRLSDKAALYVAQWVNPEPTKPLESFTVQSTGTEAVPLLFAVTARLPR